MGSKTCLLESPDTVALSRQLLGHLLCRRLPDGSTLKWPLCELEAYDGQEDKACHAHRGRTPRNEIMFGSANRWYVYLCYGVHELLNIVTGPVDYPAAVLIRGAGGIYGPGRVTKALQIGRSFITLSATAETNLWLEPPGEQLVDNFIVQTPRIGIDSVGQEWASKSYRFWIRPKDFKAAFPQFTKESQPGISSHYR